MNIYQAYCECKNNGKIIKVSLRDEIYYIAYMQAHPFGTEWFAQIEESDFAHMDWPPSKMKDFDQICDKTRDICIACFEAKFEIVTAEQMLAKALNEWKKANPVSKNKINKSEIN